jgi:Uma2 family endonuclease
LGRNGPGGWWILDEPELHLAEDVLVPDLAGWRRERMPDFPDVPHFTLVPDWVCEILSPSTARLDLALKLPLYARQGVQNVWIVDPANRSLEIFGTPSGRCELIAAFASDDQVRAAPFDTVGLPLTSLWGG